MNKHSILFIGLDTHKEFNEVAYIEDHRGAQPVHFGRAPSSKIAVKKLVRHFESKYPDATLHFVYEAGPCGYWIYRLITSLGHCCYVVAPSLIPKKPGERVKTDKRDAMKLAKLLKTEDLTPIYVPEPEDEAVRDLSRAREVAMKDLKDAKYQLKALLLRNNINYAGTANWSLKHLRWLTELVLSHPAQQLVLQEFIQTISERMARLERLDNELTHHVHQWRYYPVVKAIQAMRGVRLLVAAGVIAELGDLSRFDHPRKLMSYLGLVPSEHSSGGKRHIGAITKCGNGRARRLLIEGAHTYRYAANISTDMQKRQEGLPKQIIDIAWKAQLRLCKRYKKLISKGKHYNLVVTAIAREMIAYIWAIAKEVVLTPVDPKLRLARVPA
ncbi:IS110 family transposase [Pseudoalteromonas sp. ACER1]|jgi:transposase|uniref:IS110 family transposase n=1 Tax=unclassified Pseudoalteromonas TaxID=194690 RepID=UPI000C64AB9D|nr:MULTISPECIES: IS110 family transposase [unclassified Pseudoalteromonas]MAH28714.1 IS110 family transposase [Pseudoalteromonadaceae bacterium]MBC7011038.1 IS110 family transposase [Pseudoalteromonas sp. BZK2]MCF2850175.1 IS110 family transposase [Pseudoalteromonas sp. PAST1]MCO7213535.1 IS110 family transposase [Pseudoalteromonas sp. ACER1]TMO34820.1 IS110 family transposase [Pseudoalteromonas sp. S4491]|tara:strand:+ start:441 stop:1595 length:1155 start_codon:yes stop_codon:yes gene_type:complete